MSVSICRFVHMMVDPGILMLACVPFIVIRGLSRACAIHTCLYSASAARISQYPIQMASTNSSSSPTPGAAVRHCLLPLFNPIEANDTLSGNDLVISEKPFEQYLVIKYNTKMELPFYDLD